MRWKPACIGLLAACWMAAAPLATAETLRCDTSLVGRGMTPFEVVEVCGAPVYEFAFIEFRAPGVFVQVDEWLYELGRNKFRRLLIFENGRLRRIETRDKPRREVEATAGGSRRPIVPVW